MWNTLRRFFARSSERRYRYDPSHTVVADYAEFSGMSTTEIEAAVRNYKKLNREAWARLQEGGKSWSDVAVQFYERHNGYVFDHLSANPTVTGVVEKLDAFNPAILQSIREYRGKELLEFGGGVGVFCECMAREGFRVTYLDIPGHVKDFAEWRFDKYELPIEVLTSHPEKLSLDRDYDVVFTDAVFEHLADPDQALSEIIAHIRPGGLFAFLVDLSGPTPDEPEHHHVDIAHLHHMLDEGGFACDSGRERAISIWRKLPPSSA